jgi:hypothetical protein
VNTTVVFPNTITVVASPLTISNFCRTAGCSGTSTASPLTFNLRLNRCTVYTVDASVASLSHSTLCARPLHFQNFCTPTWHPSVTSNTCANSHSCTHDIRKFVNSSQLRQPWLPSHHQPAVAFLSYHQPLVAYTACAHASCVHSLCPSSVLRPLLYTMYLRNL